ncbi:MAG: LamG-like jellyroll fold domain-containing protein, partial [Verrucomicrobiota bacterium]
MKNKYLQRLFSCLGFILFLPMAHADPAPLHHWDLKEENWSEQEVPIKGLKAAAESARPPTFAEGGLWLKGDNPVIVSGVTGKDLPRDAISVEAWVAVDQGIKWGGILSFSQDNGSYEKGWLLGYDNTRFCFCVSAGPKLIYQYAKSPFEAGSWHHVVGTYDGQTQKLYVDGRLQATSTTARGPIDYPPKAFYVLGAYKDDNEQYPMTGKIREARVYDRALTAKEVVQRAKASGLKIAEPLDFMVYPSVRFTDPGVAEVSWRVNLKGPGAVHYGKTRKLGRTAHSIGTGPGHRALLKDLDPETLYYYKIECADRMGKTHLLDTSFDYAVPAAGRASTEYEAWAQELVKKLGRDHGMCLVVGSKTGKLAYEIARASRLHVVGVDTDAERVKSARRFLYDQGVYGSRVSIMHVDAYEKLPFTSCFANLVVSEETDVPGSLEEITRLLRPGGGLLVLTSSDQEKIGTQLNQLKEQGFDVQPDPAASEPFRLTAVRPHLKDAGEWSHQYGSPGNTASTGDTLGGAASTHDLALQWIGRPGGNFGI